jgi:thioredoxin-dependent peroxiredoxin
MRIQSGDKAKDFTVRDLNGNPLALQDFKGKKLMLSFFRYASCPFCNLRIHDLIVRHASLEKQGLSLVAVFQSPEESIRQYAGKQNPPFPIIPDPARELYRAYGVEPSWPGFLKGMFRAGPFLSALTKGFLPGKVEGETAMIPADFLIGPDLVVRSAYYGKDISDHIPLADVEAWLKEG